MEKSLDQIQDRSLDLQLLLRLPWLSVIQGYFLANTLGQAPDTSSSMSFHPSSVIHTATKVYDLPI